MSFFIVLCQFPRKYVCICSSIYFLHLSSYNKINPIRKVGFKVKTIPKPLVMVNQWTIVLSVIISLITQSVWILLIPLVANVSSLLTGVHPILLIAKRFLSKPTTQYIQEDYAQLRFNQWLAVAFLVVASISFLLNWSLLFNIATVMVGLAASVAIAGFCIGCFVRFQFQQWNYRRKKSAI